jgi:hypothetical protein
MSFSRPYSYTLHYTSDMTHSLSIDTQMDMKALLIKGIPYSVIAKRFGVSAGVVSKSTTRNGFPMVNVLLVIDQLLWTKQARP